MNTEKYLLEQIKKCRRKMNLAKLLDHGILYAAAGGLFGMLCEILSLFLPFYHAHLAAGLCFGAGAAIGIGYAVYRRADMKQAAGRLDSFGLKERMLTAYENLDKEDEFALLQRKDAVSHYDRVRERIRIPILPDKRHILALFVSAAAVAGMGLLPSPVREQAKLCHEVQEQAKEEQKALEELIEALEGVDMESLTEEQKAQLKELAEAMKLSQEELANADSRESLGAAQERLDYKYQQAAQDLEQLAGQMSDPEAAGVASAEAMAKAAADPDGQQLASSEAAASSGASGENAGNGQNGKEGSGKGDGEGDGSHSGEGDGQGDGEGSGNGNGSQDGGGSEGGNGQGDGDGSGPGNGQDGSFGNGNGQGGSGSGNGTGSGRGTGSSDAAHDYVSIPNALADDPSLTGNRDGDQDSDYYRQQNGLAWEGDHVDYSSVIGEYTDSAYEGIANGKYPSGMEGVIRDYFEDLNK